MLQIGKNTFRWHGFVHLTQTLCFLRFIGLVLDIPEDIRSTKEREVQEMVRLNQESTLCALDCMKKENIGSHFLNALPEKKYQPEELLYPSTSSAGEEKASKSAPLHILTVCQKFIMLFLLSDDPKVMSLEFASKVIHGMTIPLALQKSKSRRLYDVTNVLMAISQRCPILNKVSATRLNSGRRTAFQYIGPNVEEIPLDTSVIMKLPQYRKKHLLFDQGKRILQLPVLPDKIPHLKTVRLKAVEHPGPWPVDKQNGLDMTKVAIDDLKAPLSNQVVAQLVAKKIGIPLLKIDCEYSMNANDHVGSNTTVEEDHVVPSNEVPLDFLATEEDKEEEDVSATVPLDNLPFAILPSETTVLAFL